MYVWSCFRGVAWSRRFPGRAKSWLFCIQNERFIPVCRNLNSGFLGKKHIFSTKRLQGINAFSMS